MDADVLQACAAALRRAHSGPVLLADIIPRAHWDPHAARVWHMRGGMSMKFIQRPRDHGRLTSHISCFFEEAVEIVDPGPWERLLTDYYAHMRQAHPRAARVT